jgi:hypothetical protein
MPKIWLIVEDDNDAIVIRAMLKVKQLPWTVEPLKPTGPSGGISRLAKELPRLIQTALRQRHAGDCIAVLHDADSLTQLNRASHDRIRAICDEYQKDVTLVVARDELESWLLADKGICTWLEKTARNYDEQPKPSEILDRWLHEKSSHMRYAGRYRAEVLKHIEATGDKYSPSMRRAVQQLTKHR